jgi:hypothetical protein
VPTPSGPTRTSPGEADSFGNPWRSYGTAGRSSRGGRGGGAGEGRGSEANPFSAKGIGKLLGVGIAAEAADRFLRVGSGMAGGIATAGTAGGNATETRQNRIEGTIQQLEALKSIPVAGALFEFVDAVTGTSRSMKEYSAALGRVHEATIAGAQVELDAKARLASAAGTPAEAIAARTEAAVGGIDSQIDRLNEDEGKTGVDVSKPRQSLIRARIATQQAGKAEAAQGERIESGANAVAFNDQSAAEAGASAAELENGEGGTAAEASDRHKMAFAFRSAQRRKAIESQMATGMASATTDAARDRAKQTGEAQLAGFDREYESSEAKRDRDEARAKRQIVTGSQGEIEASKLRAQGRTDEAGIVGTRESFRGRIEDTQRLYGTDSAESKTMEAERDQKIQEQRVEIARRSAQQITAAQADGNTATLRANHEYLAADLAAFEAASAAKLELLKGQPKEVIDATKTSIDAQRAALVTQQAHQRTDIVAGLETRGQVAAAQGAGNERLAGVIGTIAGLKGELRNVSPEFRSQTISAQRAELGSLQTQTIAPNRYMTEFDPSRDATGGPNGQAGQEQLEVLKAIADYLKSLDAKTAAPTA